ncbi:ArsR/SmtB family transcription factor [Alicyclobacillus fastidiosus]|uniref:ArsR/SmtB family transcription factor n=1 Tax=Alicyclobacillus fastidiosus TaxID=392011 RepID=UPI0035303204
MRELPLLDQKNPNYIFKTYAAKFKALSDEKRLQIMNELCQRGKTCVCDLQEVLDLPQSSLSYHLKILVEAGLITRETQGTWSYYELNASEVSALLSEQLCCIFRPNACC